MKRALISVSDKEGIVGFARDLVQQGYEIISTGNTFKYLQESGIAAYSVESVTQSKEILDGRVKTLHPAVHGGILAKRDSEVHMQTLRDENIETIDLVCVNLYPFKETIMKEGVSFAEAIENIDIGGPTMLRSAAKNHRDVIVVCDSSDYAKVVAEMEQHGNVSEETRSYLALKVFNHTAHYDAMITQYLKAYLNTDIASPLTLTYELKQSLRYGENPHQSATYYQDHQRLGYAMTSATALHGKELSYNNIQDGQAALDILREFSQPTAVVVKHMNPCGVASGRDGFEAFSKAYEADPVSIFGGIVAINQTLDTKTAEVLSTIFLEVVLAPDYEDEALALLKRKKNIRILTFPDHKDTSSRKKYTSVPGGLLVQDEDISDTSASWKAVTHAVIDEQTQKDAEFAAKVVKHVKSNAIVLVKNLQTIGIGAGQMNRIGAAKIACEMAGEKAKDSVLGSDAFFPMRDTVDFVSQFGVKAIVQPGGSLKDQESIDACNEYDIAMVFTNERHFKH